MAEPRDAYKILQVDPDADLEVIQAAYRRLARKFHPDLTGGSTDAASSEVRMVEINAAWDRLRDAVRRAAYDLQRATGQRVQGGPDQPAARATRPGVSRPDHRRQPGPHPSSEAGSAGPPPGRPSGSVLSFGRYAGWSLGEISRVDPDYLEWLDRMPIGRTYEAELQDLLRRLGRPSVESAHRPNRRGFFGRR